jgi:hypothetical protein
MTNDLPTVVLVHDAFANANSDRRELVASRYAGGRPQAPAGPDGDDVLNVPDGLHDVPADLTGLAHKGVGASSGT